MIGPYKGRGHGVSLKTESMLDKTLKHKTIFFRDYFTSCWNVISCSLLLVFSVWTLKNITDNFTKFNFQIQDSFYLYFVRIFVLEYDCMPAQRRHNIYCIIDVLLLHVWVQCQPSLYSPFCICKSIGDMQSQFRLVVNVYLLQYIGSSLSSIFFH